jgi:threonylcarbamoyladenosine tRNA methylthiotransferase MtaB
MPTAAIKTLGCKLNQYESEQMREQLQRLGYTVADFDSSADLYVINSCTVTHHADRDTRRLARRVKRLNPSAFVVVTGCYAQVAQGELAAIPEIDLVCGMADKLRIGELVRGLSPQGTDPASVSPMGSVPCGDRPRESHLIGEFAEHTRCFVKVQEGCNARCAYCIIPEARGPSRSVPTEEVLAQARQLACAGHPEIVLVGTHLGQFGHDLGEDVDLAELIVRLAAIPKVQRLRLSSIEPCEVTKRLAAFLPGAGRALELFPTVTADQLPSVKLCRYLHIPLQSGCDAVLKRMNRPYDAQFYTDLIHRLHALQPAAGLGADVIVGFPGETAEEFEQTRRYLESLPFSYLHVFTYSRRRGTPAADMPDQVPHEVALARNHVLRELSERKRETFARSMMGMRLEVVLQTSEGNGWLRGVTDNYLQLRVQAPAVMLQRLVACEVEAVEGALLVGRLVP